MDILEEFLEMLNSVLELDDVVFGTFSKDVSKSIIDSFTGETGAKGIAEQHAYWRAEGKTKAEAEHEIRQYLTEFNKLINGLKEGYSSSSEKIAFLEQINEAFSNYLEETINEYAKDAATVYVQLLHPNAKIPTYASNGDQGADIYAPEDVTIAPHTYGNLVKTGIAVSIPAGWALGVRARSGMSKKTTLRLSNSYGTIDTNYKNEIGVLFDNIGDEPYTIAAGDRIAQLVLEKNYTAMFSEVEDVTAFGEDRGGGFGHSGN